MMLVSENPRLRSPNISEQKFRDVGSVSDSRFLYRLPGSRAQKNSHYQEYLNTLEKAYEHFWISSNLEIKDKV